MFFPLHLEVTSLLLPLCKQICHFLLIMLDHFGALDIVLFVFEHFDLYLSLFRIEQHAGAYTLLRVLFHLDDHFLVVVTDCGRLSMTFCRYFILVEAIFKYSLVVYHFDP